MLVTILDPHAWIMTPTNGQSGDSKSAAETILGTELSWSFTEEKLKESLATTESFGPNRRAESIGVGQVCAVLIVLSNRSANDFRIVFIAHFLDYFLKVTFYSVVKVAASNLENFFLTYNFAESLKKLEKRKSIVENERNLSRPKVLGFHVCCWKNASGLDSRWRRFA